MVTITGTYEGQTMNITYGITSPYTATATDEMIQGYGGADTIYGNALDNYIFGDQRGDRSDFDPTADGADVLYGYGGDDLIDPGAGSGNYVNGGDDTDTLDYRYATPGQALIVDIDLGTADAGSYGSTVFVNIENVYGIENGLNQISGDENDNVIHGGSFADKLYGRDGKDLIRGFDGNDILRGGRKNDTLQGGAGFDTLDGGRGRDTLVGGADDDYLRGSDGNDRLIGEAGNDRLYGDAHNDLLEGRKGRDTLKAGSGSDTLYGGGGADKFVFNKNSDDNRIMDFESRDKIQITSGAQHYFDLKFTDTNSGLYVEFGSVEIFLKGLDIGDVDPSNFIF